MLYNEVKVLNYTIDVGLILTTSLYYSGYQLMWELWAVNMQINWLRPGADQSSKAAFGKSAFLKANLLLAKALLLGSNLLLDRASLLLPKAKAFWFV